MARPAPKVRKPFKQSRADSLTQALDDSLTARGYTSTPEPPEAPLEPKTAPGRLDNYEKFRLFLKARRNVAKIRAQQFIQKNPTKSI